MRLLIQFSAFLTALFLSLSAFADNVSGPRLSLQDPASPVMERIHAFHNGMLILVSAICLLVLVLMIWVMVRYNDRANPEPATFTHNVKIEVIWTVVPAVIVLGILWFSLPMLFYAGKHDNPEMTLKVTGYQWYWGYEYPDYNDLAFNSNMIADADIDENIGQLRNLSVDNKVYLPTDTDIQIIVTASDVLHSFAVPAFGIKTDAVPGRLNETWVRITKPGVYYGQCSELCGTNHAFMPIEIHAVPKPEFLAWVDQQNNPDAAPAADADKAEGEGDAKAEATSKE
jgi:cytochrome c oxidase subunit 2